MILGQKAGEKHGAGAGCWSRMLEQVDAGRVVAVAARGGLVGLELKGSFGLRNTFVATVSQAPTPAASHTASTKRLVSTYEA
jgi:hypothetical protein